MQRQNNALLNSRNWVQKLRIVMSQEQESFHDIPRAWAGIIWIREHDFISGPFKSPFLSGSVVVVCVWPLIIMAYTRSHKVVHSSYGLLLHKHPWPLGTFLPGPPSQTIFSNFARVHTYIDWGQPGSYRWCSCCNAAPKFWIIIRACCSAAPIISIFITYWKIIVQMKNFFIY